MATDVRNYFTGRLGHSFDSRFEDLRGTVRFDVVGTGSWRLSVDHGELDLEESSQSADCTIHMTQDGLAAILDRKKRFSTSFLRGDLQIEGNRGLAAGVHNFFKVAA